MQAIEFETRIEGRSVQLPADAELANGQSVRVILMYEAPAGGPEAATTEEAATGAIARLTRDPLVVPGFSPLTREEAHER